MQVHYRRCWHYFLYFKLFERFKRKSLTLRPSNPLILGFPSVSGFFCIPRAGQEGLQWHGLGQHGDHSPSCCNTFSIPM